MGGFTWIHPLHAIWKGVVRTDAHTTGVRYGAVGKQVVPPPARVGDICVRADKTGEEEEAEGGGEEDARRDSHGEWGMMGSRTEGSGVDSSGPSHSEKRGRLRFTQADAETSRQPGEGSFSWVHKGTQNGR